MKWFLRGLVFTAALFVGFAATAAFRSDGLSNCVVNVPSTGDDETQFANPPHGVNVMYAGFGRDPAYVQPYLRFIIYNGLTHPISYEASTPYGPYAELIANRRLLSTVIGTETKTQEFDILGGDSAEVRVYSNQFTARPPKGVPIKVGFYMGDNYKPDISQPFLLPDEFREAIR